MCNYLYRFNLKLTRIRSGLQSVRNIYIVRVMGFLCFQYLHMCIVNSTYHVRMTNVLTPPALCLDTVQRQTMAISNGISTYALTIKVYKSISLSSLHEMRLYTDMRSVLSRGPLSASPISESTCLSRTGRGPPS